MKKIYIGCALTHAPPEFRQMVWKLRDLFRAKGFEVLEFGWKDGPREDINVFEFDVGKIKECEIFVALCDYPSIGLGMEFKECISRNLSRDRQILIMAFARKESKVGKIVPDLLEANHLPALVFYEDPEDIVREVVAHIEHAVT